MTSIKKLTRTESLAIVEGFVKDPEADRDKVLETIKNPESKDFSTYISDWNYVGEDGHCGYWISTPFDWWAILRRSPEVAIYDLLDHSELMKDIFSEYTNYCVAMLSRFLKEHTDIVDSVALGGSSTSMSVISPVLLDTFTTFFVRAMKKITSKYNIPLQYHMCGKSRDGIPILVDAGVDGMDALESPPTGNVDLAEVKRLYGDKISLRGNVNSITTMLEGKPEDVEQEVMRCMNDAKGDGGFILGVGDQTPYWTPDENIFALVEFGFQYGGY